MPHFLRTTPRRIFFGIMCLYAVTFLVVLPLLCEDLGFSWYFISSGALKRTWKQNKEHTETAMNYLLSQAVDKGGVKYGEFPKQYSHNKTTKREQFRICIVIPTVSREKNLHYLIQVVAKYLKELDTKKELSLATKAETKRYIYELNVFNADQPAMRNKDVPILKNMTTVSVVDRSVGLLSDSFDAPTSDVFYKEKVDYQSALEVCSKSDTDYILISEDDSFPSDNFFIKLEYILDNAQD